MRTLLLVGIAGIAALAADAAHANHGAETTRVERRVIVVDGTSRGDEAVYRSSDDRVLAESDYRGRWDGAWSGDWDDARETYEGTYRGRYERGEEAGDDERDDARHHLRREGRDSEEDLARLCRRDDGVGGAAIGAVAGGIVGNRLAGRGDRTAGTLLGAAGGAIVGAVIDRAEDGRCNDYWRRVDADGGYRHRRYRHDHGNAYRGDHGYDYNGGYYETAYSEGGSYGGGVTTIVIPGAPTIIEETETTYEAVAVAAPRARAAPRRHVRRAPARPRPRCICR